MIILPANTLSTGGYEVANSCRFNDGDSAYLNKTNGTPTDNKILTFSGWFKRSIISASDPNYLVHNIDSGATNYAYIRFSTDDTIKVAVVISGSTSTELVTNAVYRDVSAWYHVVLAVDTTQGTAANRVKLYINGTQVTSFSTETYPSQNDSFKLTENLASGTFRIGAYPTGSDYFDGYMSEVVVLDGTAAAIGDLGEFDSDTPSVFKPKDVSGLTFGTNGFYLDFEASANLGNDANGGTDFTESNLAATDQSSDSPTNNFATLNPLFPESNISYSEGNLKVSGDGSANWSSVIGTIGLTSGKWYWEWTATSSSNAFAGIVSEALVNSTLISDATPYDQNGLILYFTDGRKTVDGTDTESHFTAWSSGTMSFALDLDSGTRTIKMYHNGSQTGDTINLTANFASGDSVFPVFMVNAGSNTSLQNINFGSPPYANTSDAADANGYGAFEYAPPSGYYALCTKNLAEFG